MENPFHQNRIILLGIAGCIALAYVVKSVWQSSDSLQSKEKIGFEGPLHIPASSFNIPGTKITAPKWGSFSVGGEKQTANTIKAPDKGSPVKTAESEKKTKKKKKQAKKKVKATSFADEGEFKKSRDTEKKSGSGFSNTLTSFVSALITKPEEPLPSDPSKFESIEDWEKFLFGNPDYKNAMKLLEAYQSNQLKDPTWFHILVEKMTIDSRTEMKEIGFYLLGAAPSPRSFTILAQQFNQSGPELRDENEKRLNVYGYQKNLWSVLNVALQSGEPTSQITAARVIAQTAPHFKLNLDRQRPGRGATGQTTPFGPLKPTLENVARSDSNQDVRASATEALRVIESVGRQLTQL